MSTGIEEPIRVTAFRRAHSQRECTQSLQAVQDALYVLNGKWKLPIIIAMSTGPKRFGELQRLIKGITAKVLSKELKEMEQNEFVVRNVYATTPVIIEYELTPYSQTLDPVIEALQAWGIQHRERIIGQDRSKSN